MLALALAEVSGHAIKSREEARATLNTLPQRVIGRIWVLDKTGLPDYRFYVTKGLSPSRTRSCAG